MRLFRIAAWGLLLWLSYSWTSTGEGPEDARDCYLSAEWKNPGWEYGRQVCFEEDGGLTSSR